jgi:Domain of unknown function (DUF6362)
MNSSNRFGNQAVTDAPVDDRYVVAMLEDAGRTLLSLPSGGGFSTALQGSGMDVVRNFMDAYGWTEIRVRPPTPSAVAIDTMDHTFRWLRFIPQDRYVLRRIVGARSLVHPITDRHLYAWRRIGSTLGCDYRAVERWHREAIDLIVAKLLHEKDFIFLCSNGSKFGM